MKTDRILNEEETEQRENYVFTLISATESPSGIRQVQNYCTTNVQKVCSPFELPELWRTRCSLHRRVQSEPSVDTESQT